MRDKRSERMQEALRESAAEFLAREANREPLITVTSTSLSQDHKRAQILMTVFPESGERLALEFANRNIAEFKTFLKTRVRGILPSFIEFMIDKGEKNRQRL